MRAKRDFFSYPAEVVAVLDGDTVDVILDLGFDIKHAVRVRIAGIDAPEVKNYRRHEWPQAEAGKAVKAAVVAILECSDFVWVKSVTYGKYARRIVGEVWCQHEELEALSLAAVLLDWHMAQPYEGDTRPEWSQKQLLEAQRSALRFIQDGFSSQG